MKVSRDLLLAEVYRYYPRGVSETDRRYASTPQNQRLVAARRAAGKETMRWRELKNHIDARLGAESHDRSHHLGTGEYDAAYCAHVVVTAGECFGYLVSFVGPWYVVYVPPDHALADVTAIYPPHGVVSIDPPHASVIAAEIERLLGYDFMPPSIGNIVVSDVATPHRRLGEATLYDCLLSDSW